MFLRSPRLHLYVLVVLVHIFFIGGYVGNVMLNSITNLTVAMVDDQSLTINAYYGNSTDVSIREGDYYSGMPPGLSLLLVPAYVKVKIIFALVPDSLEERLDAIVNKKIAGMHGNLFGAEKRVRIILTQIIGIFILAMPLLLVCGYLLERLLIDFHQIPARFSQLIAVLFMLFSPYAAFSS